MKALTYVFSTAVVGIVACLVMTIVTAVRQHEAEAHPAPISIPTPAYGSATGGSS